MENFLFLKNSYKLKFFQKKYNFIIKYMVKKSIVYGYMLMYLLTGSATTLIIKAMDLIIINDHNFAHPYVQCTNLFIGESLCLLVYKVYKFIKRKKNRTSEYRRLSRLPSLNLSMVYKRLGLLSFSIPGILYMFSIYLMFIGLFLSAASVYQIIRGIISVPVLIYSLIFLKRRVYRHQLLGVFLITAGVIIVGIDSIIQKSETSKDPVMGAVLLILSQFIAAGVFVLEEYLMLNISVEPIEAVGIEGIVGLFFSLIILIILNLIPCDNSDFCYGGNVENTLAVLNEVFNN